MTNTSTNPPTASYAGLSDDHFKRIVAVITALVALLAAVIALLQGDASARDDRANRDTKRYSLEALGRKVSGDARVNYDYNAAYQSWYELDLLASSASARGDEAAAQRFLTLRDRTTSLSPLLAAPYFDAATGETNIARYEAEVYLTDITALTENFTAALAVKDAWDGKSNTYILHLTLLAVGLFLLALSVTISGPATRWLFAGAGTTVALVAAVWAGLVWAQPVVDLRERGGAIDSYARGAGLAHQSLWNEAIAAYDQALQAAPDYGAALVARAEARSAQGQYAEAAADYEKARAVGATNANVAGDLAWMYYLVGRFDDAVAMNRTALESNPGELWIRFDLGLALLAAGKLDDARAEYQRGMDQAAQQVEQARTEGAEPPSDLWWSLDDAAAGLDDLLLMDVTGEQNPPPDRVADRAVIGPVADELLHKLKSQAVALEYTGKLPAGPLTATISPFEFALVVEDENGEVIDYEVADVFEFGTDEVAVLFDYEGMRDGQAVLFKVYVDGEEDPSWRIEAPWDLGASGSAEKRLSLAYSDVFVLNPGEYVVELYVDGQLAQRGRFLVEE